MNPTEPNPILAFIAGAILGGFVVNLTRGRTQDENEADIDRVEYEEGVKALKAKKRAQAAARAKA